MTTTTWPVHPYADLFPMLADDELEALAADIAERGLTYPIWLYEDPELGTVLLDGRNRLAACQLAGVEPTTRLYEGDPLAHVLAMNTRTRHLSHGQLCVLALRLLPIYADRAKARMLAGVKDPSACGHEGPGRAADEAAKAAGVSGRSVARLARVADVEPELIDMIAANKLTVAAAEKLVKHQQVVERHRERAQERQSTAETTARITLAPWSTWLPDQPECDLLLTDPPYSTDIADIAEFAAAWLPAALAKVKPTGRAYVCIGAYPDELAAYLSIKPERLELADVLVWTYRNTLGPSSPIHYTRNWQAILHYHGPDAPPLNTDQLVEKFAVIDMNAPDGRRGERWHAWQKPDALGERLVQHSTRPGDVVLDPFAGTGTFLLAAARLGRVAMGCDQDPDMVATCKERGCVE